MLIWILRYDELQNLTNVIQTLQFFKEFEKLFKTISLQNDLIGGIIQPQESQEEGISDREENPWQFILTLPFGSLTKNTIKEISNIPGFLDDCSCLHCLTWMRQICYSCKLRYGPILNNSVVPSSTATMFVAGGSSASIVTWISKENASFCLEKLVFPNMKKYFTSLGDAFDFFEKRRLQQNLDLLIGSKNKNPDDSHSLYLYQDILLELIALLLLELLETALPHPMLVEKLLEVCQLFLKLVRKFAPLLMDPMQFNLNETLTTTSAKDLVVSMLKALYKMTKAIYIMIPYSQNMDIDQYKLEKERALQGMGGKEDFGKSKENKENNLEDKRSFSENSAFHKNNKVKEASSFLHRKVEKESRLIPKLVYEIEMLENTWLQSTHFLPQTVLHI